MWKSRFVKAQTRALGPHSHSIFQEEPIGNVTLPEETCLESIFTD